ncbi:MAG: hypothetical protein DBX91_09510 [Subdoligranulum variabile]|nr:MAG: hypothetical protein DBX91_09510 [Subdoligranulum variabile]
MQKFIALLRRNRWLAAVLAVEAAVLLTLIAGLFGAPFCMTITPDGFENPFPSFAGLNSDDGSLQIYNDEGFESEKEITFSSAPAALASGAYEVTVEYFSCQTPDAPTFNILQSAGTLTFASARTPSAVQADPLTLDDGHRTLTTRLWISSGARMSDLQATLHYNEGQLYLYSITLEEQPVYRVTRLACFLLFFAVCDLLAWGLFGVGAAGRKRRPPLVPLALAGITALACLPLFSDQLYFGHDLNYHLQRIAAMAEELSYGQFPVRIATTTLNGYGYINPLCYCELFLLLPALLYNLWLPLRACYQVYVFAVTLAAAVFSYRCFARISGSRRAGVLGAALYTLSSYRLVCVFFRGAVGEYTAISFLPLVLLGVWQIYSCEKPRFAQWAPLAFGMAALVQCHLISTELTAALLAVFCLLRLRQTFAPARLLAWCKAAALAFGLSAWFLLPFLATTMSVGLQVNNPSVGKPQQEGLYPLQLLAPFGPGYGGTSAGTSTDMSLNLGLPLLLGLALAVYCLTRRREAPRPRPLSTVTGLGLLALLLTMQIFPWDFVESWLGAAAAKAACTFQYPWRFLALAVPLFCAATLLALRLLGQERPRAARAFAGVLAAAVLLSTAVFQMQLLPTSETSANSMSQNGTRDVGLGEYMIDGCSIYETVWAQPKPGSDDLTLTGYEKTNGVAYLSVENAGDEAEISVPIFNYGHYRAEDAAGTVFPMRSGENARIVLDIPAGYSGTIEIFWASPLWWRGCEVLSLLCAAGCLVWALRIRRRLPRA